MIGKIFLSPKNNKKVKVLKQYEIVVLCLDLDDPIKIFWHKEIQNKHIIEIANLKPIINIDNKMTMIQGKLF